MSDPSADSSVIESARRAGTFVFAAQIAGQIISIVSLAVLYRLLSATEFGVFGQVLPLAILPRMAATLGFTFATIQRPDLSPAERTALFWWNLLFGGIAAAVTIFLAWNTSMLYPANPGLRLDEYSQLVYVAAALAGVTVLAALGSQHQAMLERELQFAELSSLRLGGQCVGAIAAIAVAWFGWGVWSLVLQQVVETGIISGGAWVLEPWRPGSPASGKLSGGSTRFSFFLALTNLTFHLGQNIDKWVLPFASGFALLGLYSQAFNWMMRPVYLLTTPLSSVMLPTLSRLHERELAAQGNDDRAREAHENFEHAASVFYRLTAIILCPVSVGLAIMAPDVMLLLGGPKWLLAGWILAILSLAIAPQGLINITGSLLAARGKAASLWLASLAVTLALIVGYSVGGFCGIDIARYLLLRDFPIPIEFTTESEHAFTMGVAVGFAATTLLVIATTYLPWAWRTAGLQLSSLWAVLFKPIFASLTMGVIVYLIRRTFPLDEPLSNPRLAMKIVACVIIGVVAYGILNFTDVVWALTHGRNINKPPK
jgi:O-antigen/teichoic acid export membrane protein